MSPNSILKFLKKFLVEKFSRHRIPGTIQEPAEIHGLFGLVGKSQANLMFSQILCLRDGDGLHVACLQILLVIISDGTVLL